MVKKYPKSVSKVTITFMDGEVREFMMTAGVGISKYLCSEAATTGFVSLQDFDTKQSINVPVVNIRDFSVQEQQLYIEHEETDG